MKHDVSREPLLEVSGLRVRLGSKQVPFFPVDGVDFCIGPGESVALVGESGCGKTLTALSLTRLPSELGAECEGRVFWRGRSVLAMTEPEIRGLRGGGIAYVFQDSLSALNPVRRVGSQLAEAVRLHGRPSSVRNRVYDLLGRVGLPDPSRQARAYPHELSGGMRQRVLLALALACRPALLVADEPTTALDPTVQAQILALLDEVRRTFNMALLLVTHDLGLAWEQAQKVLIMYAGKIVEAGPMALVWASPMHPYTQALFECLPGLRPNARLRGIPGNVPSPKAWPSGCRFHPRCSFADALCKNRAPEWVKQADGRQACCHHPLSGPS